ncbi:MAG: hypothetical protein ACO4CG_04225 [Prochlorothrix sp.]
MPKKLALSISLIFNTLVRLTTPAYAVHDNEPSLQELLRCSNSSLYYTNSSGWLIEKAHSCSFNEHGHRWSFLKATKDNHTVVWRFEGGSGLGTYEVLSVNTDNDSYILYEAAIGHRTVPGFLNSMQITNVNGLNIIPIRDLAIVVEWQSDLYRSTNNLQYLRSGAENPCTANRDDTQGSFHVKRDLTLQEFGIILPIPSYYRSMAMQDGSVQVLSPRNYQSLSCVARGGKVLGSGLDLNYTIQEVNIDTMQNERKRIEGDRSYINLAYQNEAVDGIIIHSSRAGSTYFMGYSVSVNKAIQINMSCDCQQNLQDFIIFLESVRPL